MNSQDQSILRQNFLYLLSKLSLPETRDNSIKEIYKLITQNQSPQNIHIYLSCLFDYKRPLQPNNEYEVLLIGFLANLYKTSLVDPGEKVPHVAKTVLKLINLLQPYFKDEGERVLSACSKTWRDLYVNCLLGQPLQVRILLMFDTLWSGIIGGMDRVAQKNCMVILKDFVDCLGKINDCDYLKEIAGKVFPGYLV